MDRKWWIFKNEDKEKEEINSELNTREIIGNKQLGNIKEVKFRGISDETFEPIVIPENSEAARGLDTVKPAIEKVELEIRRKEDEIAEIKNKLERIKSFKEYQKIIYEMSQEIMNLSTQLAQENNPEKRKSIEDQIRNMESEFSTATIEVAIGKKSKELREIESTTLEDAELKTKELYDAEMKKLKGLKAKLSN